MLCYESQFGGDRAERLKHYILSAAGMEGASAGFRYGETYALPRPVGVTDMIALLGDWKIPPPFPPGGGESGSLGNPKRA